MNKNGFTLIELLAVIVILSLLVLLTSTAVTKIVKDSKQELSDAQIATIESAAKLWGADNLDRLPAAGECGYITLEDLKKLGLIDSSVVDPNTNEEISNELKIKTTTTTSEYGVPITSYEVNPTSVSGCRYSIALCDLIEGESKQIGSKYTCHLDIDRNFYVLKVSGNNITLIMDRNLGDTVGWCSDESRCKSGNYFSNSFGPLTAQDALDTRTSSWKNLKYISIDVVLPQVSWFSDLGCTSTNNSCPSWVYINLTTTSGQKPWGYWTANKVASKNMNAYGIKRGSIKDYDTVQSTGEYGIRPAIIINSAYLSD